MATAKIGNLAQLRPFPIEISTNKEREAEIIEEAKKSKAHLTQFIFIQDHENLIIDLIKKENAIKVINASVIDLLNIIKNGIKIHEAIKTL
jgi:hypothetical protein